MSSAAASAGRDVPTPSPATYLVAGAGTASLSWQLPPGVEFDLEAVYVAVNAAGAGSDVTAELTITDVSGQVIAKKPQTATIPAAGSGSATFALRLGDDSGDGGLGLHWGTNADATSLGLVLNGQGAFDFETGGATWANGTSGGDYTLEAAQGDVTIESSGADVGQLVKLRSGGQVTAQASSQLLLTGDTVILDGLTSALIEGATVQTVTDNIEEKFQSGAGRWRVANAAGTSLLEVTGAPTVKAGTALNMDSHKITNLTPGAAATDAATVSQLGSLTVKDGTTTVTPATTVKFTGSAVVTNAGGGEADVAIPSALPPSGAAGGDLGATYPNPTVVAVEETGGPTRLAVGAIANGDYLTRSGSSIVGGSPTPGGPPTGAAGGDLGGTYPNPTVAAIHETAGPTKLTVGSVPDGNYLLRSGTSLIGGTAPGVVGADGWVSDSNTWTYASGSGGGTATFTVAGDVTAQMTPGTRIKLTQTTVKYFVVVSSVVAAGTTTVTVSAGSDYTLANAAITAPFYSYMASPQGYPTWFTFNCAPTGFSGTPTQAVSRFSVIGKQLTVAVEVTGTSNATTATISTPITINSTNATIQLVNQVVDGGTTRTSPGRLVASSDTSLTVAQTMAGGAWVNSGTKKFDLLAVFELH